MDRDQCNMKSKVELILPAMAVAEVMLDDPAGPIKVSAHSGDSNAAACTMPIESGFPVCFVSESFAVSLSSLRLNFNVLHNLNQEGVHLPFSLLWNRRWRRLLHDETIVIINKSNIMQTDKVQTSC
jgi:hypothetical protein